MPNFQTFFKSKTLPVLIPVLILVLLTLGYFFVSNNSQKATKTSSQNSISAGYQANLISQNLSQGNFASSQPSNSKSEISKPEQLFSQNNQIQPLIADAEHDVVVLEECDLAVRFPKELVVENNPFRLSKDWNNIKEKIKNGTLSGLNRTGDWLNVNCDQNNQKKLKDKILNDLDSGKIIKQIHTNLTNNTFLDINDKDKSNINIYQNNNGRPFLDDLVIFTFEFKDKFYVIYNTSLIENFPTIRFQFNSLAPSVPSVSL